MMAPHEQRPQAAALDRLYAKVTRRIVPLMILGYIAAYLDRVNVGFAKLQMLGDLKFSETVYGLGAGIFFVGYFLFEVPSNMALHRIGARRWLARIMISWGIISAAMMFVTTPASFYALRFLLGAAEAGFFPGVIYYLTQWYPAARRGRIVALFMTAVALCSVAGSIVSGAIMQAFDGVSGLAGWQWLFLVEALPAIAIGVYFLLRLTDNIQVATWLTPDEKAVLAAQSSFPGFPFPLSSFPCLPPSSSLLATRIPRVRPRGRLLRRRPVGRRPPSPARSRRRRAPATASSVPPIRPVPSAGRRRRSPSPREWMWLIDRLDSGRRRPSPRRCRSACAGPRLARAWNAGSLRGRCAGHEVLRTTFPVVGGRPVQRLAPAAPLAAAADRPVRPAGRQRARPPRGATPDAEPARRLDLKRVRCVRALLLVQVRKTTS